MKFMLLIGGSRAAWDVLSPEEWVELENTHGTLKTELAETGEFIECDELNVTPNGTRIVRVVDGSVVAEPGPLVEAGNYDSGYYFLQCRDIERAAEIAARLYESRFAPIEVRQVGS